MNLVSAQTGQSGGTVEVGAELGASELVVVDDSGEPPEPNARVVSARQWLTDPRTRSRASLGVDNRCKDLSPHGAGYYTSLLAEARGLPVSPSTRQILGMRPNPRRARGEVIGVLIEPFSKLAPSDPAGLSATVDAIHRAGRRSELIQVGDAARLKGLSALLVRSATAATGPVMELLKKAHAMGIAMLEPPDVVLRCCDKAFQAERFAAWNVPTPRTLLVVPDDVQRIIDTLGLPCVLKLPDSSSGRDVVRVDTPAALDSELRRLGQRSAVLVAQAWTPSEFDWRIGTLDGELLFASRYNLVPGHWQVHRWEGDQIAEAGPDHAVPFSEVPPAVLRAALTAAGAVGGGLLGVDVKFVNNEAYVIEVNDTPTVWRGDEDLLGGDLFYDRLIGALLRRMGPTRRSSAPDGSHPRPIG